MPVIDANVRVELSAEEMMAELSVQEVMAYFNLFDENFIDEIEEGFQDDLHALNERIEALERENMLLKGNV